MAAIKPAMMNDAAKIKPLLYRDDDKLKTFGAYGWLLSKRLTDQFSNQTAIATELDVGRDGNHELWRIHNKYYDLKNYAHPGGKQFLQLTQGTDCTEAFESHHVDIRKAKKILNKFYVCDAKNLNDSIYSFKEGDFYFTLRDKIFERLKKTKAVHGTLTGPSKMMMIHTYGFILAYAVNFLLLLKYQTIYNAIATAVLLVAIFGVGHNFLHQADSWLRYVMGFTGFNSTGFRISHVLSHHLFPNTVVDIEVSALEPVIHFLTLHEKKQPFFMSLGYHVMFFLGAFIAAIQNIICMFGGVSGINMESTFVWVQLAMLYVVCDSFMDACFLWFIMLGIQSYGILAGGFLVHHGIDEHGYTVAYHQGDSKYYKQDFGEYQVTACNDHGTDLNTFWALLLYAGLNNHTLHHLFPSVDHSRFKDCKDVFLETLQQFNIDYKQHDVSFLHSSLVRHVTSGVSKVKDC